MKSALLCAALLTASPLLAAESSIRLGNEVVPLRESLILDLDPADGAFRGRAIIDVRITKPVSTIWLNATGLEVDHSCR